MQEIDKSICSIYNCIDMHQKM